MVYAGSVGKDSKANQRDITLGVSGRLMGSGRMRNLVMWDPETESLWSQIRGEALSGPLRGRKLRMLPAVFVGLETWKKMHPETLVLDLSPVRRQAWHFTAEDLARAAVTERRRDGEEATHALGLGLREGAATAVVDLGHLQREGVVEVALSGAPRLCVWVAPEKAALVYDGRLEGKSVRFPVGSGPGVERKDAAGTTWDLLKGRALAGPNKGARLKRAPYVPTYVEAWTTYYPQSRVVKAR